MARLKKVLLWIFVASVAAGLGLFLEKGFAGMRGFGWRRVDIVLAGASLLLYSAVNVISFFGWYFIYRRLSGGGSIKEKFKWWVYSLFGKYSFLGVGQPLGRLYLAGRYGLKREQVFSSLVLEQAFIAISACLYAAFGIFFVKGRLWGIWPLAGLALGFFVLVWPPVLEKVINIILKIVRKDKIRVDFSLPDVLLWVLIYTAGWGAVSLSFYYFLRGTLTWQGGNIILPGALAALAFISGYLAPFMPAGLGVREGVLAFLLAKNMGVDLPKALVLSVGFRLIIVLSEGLCAGTARMIR